jgi:beta-galactosidase
VRLSTGDNARHWSEVVELDGAEAVAAYGDGLPAVTRNRFGNGVAWYVSTRLDGPGLSRVLTLAGADDERDRAGGLDLVRRRASGTTWLFAINNSGTERILAARGTDLLSGAAIDGELRLPPGGCAVVREAPT